MKPILINTKKQLQINSKITSVEVMPQNFAQTTTLLLLHFFLGILFCFLPFLVFFHAWGTLAIGLWWCINNQYSKALYVSGYLVGAEILWRMQYKNNFLPVFWEFGKYALILILFSLIIKRERNSIQILPILYFLVLLPSTLLTLNDLGLSLGRGQISFNLSGPLALMICSWFFLNLKLSKDRLFKVFVSIILPLAGTVGTIVFSVSTATKIVFTGESNNAMSGGFGPNQVSAALGLGALLAFLLVVFNGDNRRFKNLMQLCFLVFGSLSALTFSRGGLYMALCGIFGASFFLLQNRRTFSKLLRTFGIIFLFCFLIVLPILDDFTGGAFSTRFQDTNLTGRDTIMSDELELFFDNPILGVGPGRAKDLRARNKGNPAHTEVSRLLAEHGMFGIIAILILIILAVQSITNAKTNYKRALMASLLCYSAAFIMASAMRLSAPAYLFGLSLASIVSSNSINSKKIFSKR